MKTNYIDSFCRAVFLLFLIIISAYIEVFKCFFSEHILMVISAISPEHWLCTMV